MGLSSEVTYNIFDPVGVLVDAVGLPIDLIDVIGVFVDPRGVQGVHERLGLVSEVTYNIFDPMGVLVHAMGLPIDWMECTSFTSSIRPGLLLPDRPITVSAQLLISSS